MISQMHMDMQAARGLINERFARKAYRHIRPRRVFLDDGSYLLQAIQQPVRCHHTRHYLELIGPTLALDAQDRYPLMLEGFLDRLPEHIDRMRRIIGQHHIAFDLRRHHGDEAEFMGKCIELGLHGPGYATCVFSHSTSWLFGSEPTLVAIALPSLNRIIVGMPRTPYF